VAADGEVDADVGLIETYSCFMGTGSLPCLTYSTPKADRISARGKGRDREIRDLVRMASRLVCERSVLCPCVPCIEKRGSDGEHKTIWLDPFSVRWLKKSRVH
jgi:hypothetical protein